MGGLPGAVMVETGCEADREPEIEASVATARGWIHGGQQWLLASPQLLGKFISRFTDEGDRLHQTQAGSPGICSPLL